MGRRYSTSWTFDFNNVEDTNKVADRLAKQAQQPDITIYNYPVMAIVHSYSLSRRTLSALDSSKTYPYLIFFT